MEQKILALRLYQQPKQELDAVLEWAHSKGCPPVQSMTRGAETLVVLTAQNPEQASALPRWQKKLSKRFAPTLYAVGDTTLGEATAAVMLQKGWKLSTENAALSEMLSTSLPESSELLLAGEPALASAIVESSSEEIQLRANSLLALRKKCGKKAICVDLLPEGVTDVSVSSDADGPTATFSRNSPAVLVLYKKQLTLKVLEPEEKPALACLEIARRLLLELPLAQDGSVRAWKVGKPMPKPGKLPKKPRPFLRKFVHILALLLLLSAVAFAGIFFWYRSQVAFLSPQSEASSGENRIDSFPASSTVEATPVADLTPTDGAETALQSLRLQLEQTAAFFVLPEPEISIPEPTAPSDNGSLGVSGGSGNGLGGNVTIGAGVSDPTPASPSQEPTPPSSTPIDATSPSSPSENPEPPDSDTSSSDPASSAPSDTPTPTAPTIHVTVGGEQRTMDLQEALCQIVAAEMPAGQNIEAYKAQAVAAHSWIMSQGDNSVTYPGVVMSPGRVTSTIRQAVAAVYQQVLSYNGAYATTTYFASCNGRTISSAEMWGGTRAYLVAVDSPYDEAYAGSAWNRVDSFTAARVADAANRYYGVNLYDYSSDPNEWFSITARNADQYVSSVRVGNISVSGTGFYSHFASSPDFEIRYDPTQYQEDGGLFIFTAKGYGHCVGMSQWGACGYAANGWSYVDILAHYYPGTQLVNIY